MKKRTVICSLFVIAAQLYSVSGYAYMRVTQSGTNDAVSIIADGYSPYETLPVMLLKPGKGLADLENATKDIPTENLSDVVGYMSSLSADKDGNISGEIDLSAFSSGNTYGVVVNGKLYDLKFVSNADRNAVISEMLAAANANDQATLQTKFSENKYCLSIDNNILEASGGISDASVAALLMTELKGKSSLTVGEMSETAGKAMLTAALNAKKISDKDIVDHILTGGQYSAVNTALKGKINADGIKSFISRINGAAYKSVSDAENKMAKELILSAVCYPENETTGEILAVLSEHGDVLGLNLTEFNKLSAEGKGTVLRSFVNQKPTLLTMQSVLNGLVTSALAKEKQVGGGNSGGGGGGGTSGGTYPGMSAVSDGADSNNGEADGNNGAENSVFNDIGGYSWAKEAITALYSAGVISGYGDGRFAPGNSIKREEFVKIAVSAFFGDADEGVCDFYDVAEGEWYYKYIAVAASRGIISGMGDGLFGVGSNIARQDMAVILYRIAGDGLAKPEEYTAFSDDEDIADYAKEAVYALRAAGVINGVSDTEFAPRKNATRAETAVMVYRFFKLIGKGGV